MLAARATQNSGPGRQGSQNLAAATCAMSHHSFQEGHASQPTSRHSSPSPEVAYQQQQQQRHSFLGLSLPQQDLEADPGYTVRGPTEQHPDSGAHLPISDLRIRTSGRDREDMEQQQHPSQYSQEGAFVQWSQKYTGTQQGHPSSGNPAWSNVGDLTNLGAPPAGMGSTSLQPTGSRHVSPHGSPMPPGSPMQPTSPVHPSSCPPADNSAPAAAAAVMARSLVKPPAGGKGERSPSGGPAKGEGGPSWKRLEAWQIEYLERCFAAGETEVDRERREKLAAQLKVKPRQVAVWFQNRRGRWNLESRETEVTELRSALSELQHKYAQLEHCHQALVAQLLPAGPCVHSNHCPVVAAEKQQQQLLLQQEQELRRQQDGQEWQRMGAPLSRGSSADLIPTSATGMPARAGSMDPSRQAAALHAQPFEPSAEAGSTLPKSGPVDWPSSARQADWRLGPTSSGYTSGAPLVPPGSVSPTPVAPFSQQQQQQEQQQQQLSQPQSGGGKEEVKQKLASTLEYICSILGPAMAQQQQQGSSSAVPSLEGKGFLEQHQEQLQVLLQQLLRHKEQQEQEQQHQKQQQQQQEEEEREQQRQRQLQQQQEQQQQQQQLRLQATEQSQGSTKRFSPEPAGFESEDPSRPPKFPRHSSEHNRLPPSPPQGPAAAAAPPQLCVSRSPFVNRTQSAPIRFNPGGQSTPDHSAPGLSSLVAMIRGIAQMASPERYATGTQGQGSTTSVQQALNAVIQQGAFPGLTAGPTNFRELPSGPKTEPEFEGQMPFARPRSPLREECLSSSGESAQPSGQSARSTQSGQAANSGGAVQQDEGAVAAEVLASMPSFKLVDRMDVSNQEPAAAAAVSEAPCASEVTALTAATTPTGSAPQATGAAMNSQNADNGSPLDDPDTIPPPLIIPTSRPPRCPSLRRSDIPGNTTNNNNNNYNDTATSPLPFADELRAGMAFPPSPARVFSPYAHRGTSPKDWGVTGGSSLWQFALSPVLGPKEGLLKPSPSLGLALESAEAEAEREEGQGEGGAGPNVHEGTPERHTKPTGQKTQGGHGGGLVDPGPINAEDPGGVCPSLWD